MSGPTQAVSLFRLRRRLHPPGWGILERFRALMETLRQDASDQSQ